MSKLSRSLLLLLALLKSPAQPQLLRIGWKVLLICMKQGPQAINSHILKRNHFRIGVGGLCGEISAESSVSVVVVVVSQVYKRSLGANTDTILAFFRAVDCHLGALAVAAGCHCSPSSSQRRWKGFNLCLHRSYFFA